MVDRATGVLLAAACGDALGVPYEFSAVPLGPGTLAAMVGGGLGGYAPGEYSDDTQMASCIAVVAATGADLTTTVALDRIANLFCDWFDAGPADIGTQTAAVLGRASRHRSTTGTLTASDLTAVSRGHAATHSHAAGNGALMRTAPVALAHLYDRDACATAARAIADLTHADPVAGDSAVLWSELIRATVLTGELAGDAALDALDLVPVERRDTWAGWVRAALADDPATFNPNGWTVTAFQAAYAVTVRTPVPDLVPPTDPRPPVADCWADPPPGWGSYPCQQLQDALHAAVRIGNDTDTVAAIAGGLLGARWGGSAVPWHWRRAVHGWAPAGPGLVPATGPVARARDLTGWATLAVRGGRPDPKGYPTGTRVDYPEPPTPAVAHPHDPGVFLGTAHSTGPGVTEADAVVSLCRVGTTEPWMAHVPAADRLEVRLMDDDDLAANVNLPFVLADTAAAIAGLRAEGKQVFVHCVAAHQRTPSAAAAYSRLLGQDPETTRAEISQVLRSSLRGHGLLWETALR